MMTHELIEQLIWAYVIGLPIVSGLAGLLTMPMGWRVALCVIAWPLAVPYLAMVALRAFLAEIFG